MLDGTKLARLPEALTLLTFALARPYGLPGRNGKDLWGDAEELLGVLTNEAENLLTLLNVEDVDLIEDNRDLLPPLLDQFEEGTLTLGEGSIGRGGEEDQISAGDELAGELFMAADDRVRTRGIDNRELA